MESIRDLIRNTTVLELGPLPAPRLPRAATVAQGLRHLVRARRGAVVVVDGMRPIGIFTERDVLTRVGDGGLDVRGEAGQRPLAELMSQPVSTVRRQATLQDTIAQMHQARHRHLVVVDRMGELRGLLTSSDVVQYLADLFPEDVVNLPPRLHQQLASPDGA